MCNRFASLRHKPTVRFGRRPYPNATNYETVRVVEVGGNYIEYSVARFRGVWVCGYSYRIGADGGRSLPNVRDGWFDNRRNAELYILGDLLDRIQPYGHIRRALFEKMQSIRQLELDFDV